MKTKAFAATFTSIAVCAIHFSTPALARQPYCAEFARTSCDGGQYAEWGYSTQSACEDDLRAQCQAQQPPSGSSSCEYFQNGQDEDGNWQVIVFC